MEKWYLARLMTLSRTFESYNQHMEQEAKDNQSGVEPVAPSAVVVSDEEMQRAIEDMQYTGTEVPEETPAIEPDAPQVIEMAPIEEKTPPETNDAVKGQNEAPTATETGGNQEIRDEKGRFAPGVSGNPGGKPKGKHMTTLIRQMLKDITYKMADGQEVTADVAIVRRLIDKAAKGGDRSIQEIIDRTDGKPKETVEVSRVDITPEAQEAADRALEDYLMQNGGK